MAISFCTSSFNQSQCRISDARYSGYNFPPNTSKFPSYTNKKNSLLFLQKQFFEGVESIRILKFLVFNFQNTQYFDFARVRSTLILLDFKNTLNLLDFSSTLILIDFGSIQFSTGYCQISLVSRYSDFARSTLPNSKAHPSPLSFLFDLRSLKAFSQIWPGHVSFGINSFWFLKKMVTSSEVPMKFQVFFFVGRYNMFYLPIRTYLYVQ